MSVAKTRTFSERNVTLTLLATLTAFFVAASYSVIPQYWTNFKNGG